MKTTLGIFLIFSTSFLTFKLIKKNELLSTAPFELKKPSTITFIKSSKSLSQSVQYVDKFSDTEVLDFGKLDTIKILTDDPIVVLNTVGFTIKWLIFYPNETVHLVADNTSASSIYQTGKAERDNELLYSETSRYLPVVKKNVSNNYKKIFDDIDKQTNQDVAKFKAYTLQHNVSKSFSDEELSNLNYIKYLKKAASLTSKENLTEADLAEYKTLLTNSKYSYLPSYRNFLYYYLENVKRLNKSNPVYGSFNWVKANTSGNTRDIMLFMLVKDISLSSGFADQKNILKQYIETSHDSSYQQYLSKNIVLTQAKFLDRNYDLLINKDNKTQSLKNLLLSSKNKVVFIDLWASWCLPCRAEMPYSKNLKNSFKDDSRIRFIYLSIDKNKAAWERAESELLPNEDQSYLLVNGSDAEFAKKIKLKTIPRYVICNNKGEMISSDAPRPSDLELKNLLVKLLEK